MQKRLSRYLLASEGTNTIVIVSKNSAAGYLTFLNTFSQVFETLDLIKKTKQNKKRARNTIYTRFDCFHAVTLHPAAVSVRIRTGVLAARNCATAIIWLQSKDCRFGLSLQTVQTSPHSGVRMGGNVSFPAERITNAHPVSRWHRSDLELEPGPGLWARGH